ncbi:OmpA family protein [Sorangium sp. So ce118]
MIRKPSWNPCRARVAGALGLAALVAAGACGSPQPSAPSAGLPPSGAAPRVGAPGQDAADDSRASPASAAPAPGGAAGAGLLRCPTPGGDSTGAGWLMGDEGRICCASRAPVPGWKPATLEGCLDAGAKGLAPPSYVVHPVEKRPVQETIPFARGSSKLTRPAPLESLARLLSEYPDGNIFVHGTTPCGESPSEAAGARLAASRVAAVRGELERRGVPASRLLTLDREAFFSFRGEIHHEEAVALASSPAVLLRAHLSKPRKTELTGDRCLPGATAALSLPAAEMEGDALTVEVCHAARCATAQLSLAAMRPGDRVALALSGQLSAGAFLAWKEQARWALDVRTVVEDEQALARGDVLSLRVQVDGRPVAQVQEPLTYTRDKQHPGSRFTCLQARVQGQSQAAGAASRR